MQITITKRINAPIGCVFDHVADPKKYAKAVGAKSIHFISKKRAGAGTQFRMTQSVRYGLHSTRVTSELAIRECLTNELVCIIEYGTSGPTSETRFDMKEICAGTSLKLTQTFYARDFVDRFKNWFIKGGLERQLQEEIKLLALYCQAYC